MTGFGRASAQADCFSIEVELNSVNRKTLEVNCNLPREWSAAEPVLRKVLAEQIHRGMIQVNLRPRTAAEATRSGAMQARIAEFSSLAAAYGVEPPLTAEVLYRLSRENSSDLPLPAWEEVKDAVHKTARIAVDDLLRSRAEEGARLLKEFEELLASLSASLDNIAAGSAAAPEQHRKNLLQRLAKYDLGFDLSDERVLREIALYAERGDVSEELARLQSHVLALRDTLPAANPIGRQMEFTLQEIHRELNTIGSKTTVYEVSRFVIEAKQATEKMREQAANVE